MIPWVVIDRRHLRHSTPISSSKRLCVRLISRLSPKSLPHNLFADPHPLTPIASIFYKKGGGRRGTTPDLRPLFPHPPKFFRCNTYGPPRKCCKHRTYRNANSFKCNTYKNAGGPSLKPKAFLSALFLPSFRSLHQECFTMGVFCVNPRSSPTDLPRPCRGHAHYAPLPKDSSFSATPYVAPIVRRPSTPHDTSARWGEARSRAWPPHELCH